MRLSVIVPSHNRPVLLAASVAGILDSIAGCDSELIVVDDGSNPPLVRNALSERRSVTVVRLEGEGPAAARNAGARLAQGDVLLFTDDDAVPSPEWARAALAYLDFHHDAVAVTGPIRSVPWDPLYEQSLEALEAGHCWTCNIAYRRSVFEHVGGFRPALFVHAHAEDRDLALRAMQHGAIGFTPAMRVAHTPRPFRIRDAVRQARWARDDLALYALYPQLTFGFTLPARLALVVGSARAWLERGLDRRGPPLTARRLLRTLVLAGISSACTAWTVIRPPDESLQE
jgi:GT2 family glycosyltransferase